MSRKRSRVRAGVFTNHSRQARLNELCSPYPPHERTSVRFSCESRSSSSARVYPATVKTLPDQLKGPDVARLQQEARGLQVFADPQKGNCASCHPVQKGADGSPPLLTDYSFAALGVPRNRALAANADPAYFDEGLCGPLRQPDAVWKDKFCGMFKTPSLRKVATRRALMHNGASTDLASAVRFYAERDIHPERWYPRDAKGRVDRFDDLPVGHRGNVDRLTPPMDRKPGDAPALADADVRDIVAFLRTLTDEDAIEVATAR